MFSGLTVGIGLLALVVLPVPFLRSAGIGGVLIPLVSVAVALAGTATLAVLIIPAFSLHLGEPTTSVGDEYGRLDVLINV